MSVSYDAHSEEGQRRLVQMAYSHGYLAARRTPSDDVARLSFTIWFAVRRGHASLPEHEHPLWTSGFLAGYGDRLAQTHTWPVPPKGTASPTVLVADDDDAIRHMLSILLSRTGYIVVLADNGQDALNCAIAQPPHIILMDLSMPMLSGWEATTYLKADPDLCHIPVIAMTAHSLGSLLDQAWDAGIDDFLPKPLDIEVLLSTLQHHREAGGQDTSPAHSD